MNVKQLETEKNYDDGNDRVWYQVDGISDELDGVYGVINGAIVEENGLSIDDDMPDNDTIAIRRALNM